MVKSKFSAGFVKNSRNEILRRRPTMNLGDYLYTSPLTIPECIDRIISPPWSFRADPSWIPYDLWYECQMLSPTQLRVSFTGGVFRKRYRANYEMVFSSQEQVTVIEVYCCRRHFWDMHAPTQDIDAFMSQKIQATRVKDD